MRIRLLLIGLLVLVTPIVVKAQNGLLSNTFTSVAAGGSINLLTTGISYHKITWNVVGTVTTCTVALDSSSDGVNWSAGAVIAGQTCTSNGASSVANVTANYVRMNTTTFSGTGSVSVTWTGYVNSPGGGSGLPAGPTSPNGVTQVLGSTPSGGVPGAGVYAPYGIVPNVQASTPYQIGNVTTDRGGIVVMNLAGASVVNLPQASSSASSYFGTNFYTTVCDQGAGTATLTPATSTLTVFNGNSVLTGQTTLAINTGQCYGIISDNTNYDAVLQSGGGGGISYAVGGGTAQAQTVALTSVTSYTDGMIISWLPSVANTGAGPTINVSNLGARLVTKGGINASSPLIANDLLTQVPAIAQYSSSLGGFTLINPQAEHVASNDFGAGPSPPPCVKGTAGGMCSTEGTGPTGLVNTDEVYADSTQHAESVNNNNTGNVPISRILCAVNITPVTLPGTSTTADQNLQSCIVPANLLNVVGRTLIIHTAGVYTTAAASSAAMTLEAKLCTVSLCGSGTVVDLCDITSSALGALSISNDTWSLYCWASTQTAGTSSVYERSGELAIDLLVSNAAADSVFLDPNATAVTAPVIDSTAQLFLQISIAFSVASANNVATGRQLIVEVLN